MYFRDEIKANTDPYEEELRLIANLIQYCLRFELPPGATAANANANNPGLTTSNGFLAVPGQSGHPRRGSHESGLRDATSGKGKRLLLPTKTSHFQTITNCQNVPECCQARVQHTLSLLTDVFIIR